MFRSKVEIVCHHQVQSAVMVVIKPGSARAPSPLVRHSRLGRHIAEGPIAIVVVQDGLSEADDVEVGKPIVIVVTNRDPHPENAGRRHACLGGDVCKRPIAVVAIQRSAQRTLRLIHLSRRAIHQVEIQPPIVIEVDPRRACSHGFDQVLFGRSCIVVPECDSGRRRDVD